MSRPPLVPSVAARRRTAALAAAAAAFVSPAPAAAATTTVDLRCTWPYVGAQPARLAITGELPATASVGDPLTARPVSAELTVGGAAPGLLGGLGVARIGGGLYPGAVLDEGTSKTAAAAAVLFEPQSAAGGADGAIRLVGAGRIGGTVNGKPGTGDTRFTKPGTAAVTVSGAVFFPLAQRANGDAVDIYDADPPLSNPPGTNPVPQPSVPCTTASGAPVALGTIEVGGPPATTMPAVTPAPPTPTPAPPTPEPTRIPEPTPTPVATPEPTRIPEFDPYTYDVTGAATLRSLVQGTIPLSGTVTARFERLGTRVYGELALDPTRARLTALGVIPVDATVAFVSTEPFTNGSLRDGRLAFTAKVRVKVPSARAYGLELAGGANCQTRQVSQVTLASTGASFSPFVGGPVAGTFGISDLSGCGFLNGLVSTLTASSSNVIALDLRRP